DPWARTHVRMRVSKNRKRSQMLLHQLDNLVKRWRIVNRDLGQRLPVQLDVGVLQAADELAVTQAAHPTSGVDADDPQPAEFALADPAVAESVTPRPDERHQRLAVEIMAALAETLRQLARPLATALQGDAAACTYHGRLLFDPRESLRSSRGLFIHRAYLGAWAKCGACISGRCDPPRRSCGAIGVCA